MIFYCYLVIFFIKIFFWLHEQPKKHLQHRKDTKNKSSYKIEQVKIAFAKLFC